MYEQFDNKTFLHEKLPFKQHNQETFLVYIFLYIIYEPLYIH